MTGTGFARAAALAAACALASEAALAAEAAAAGDSLRFERGGRVVRELSLAELREACHETTITVERDPYYEKRKRYRACPLAQVLVLGFGVPPSALAGQTVFFRARDGYVKPAPAELVAEPGGYVAFADADLPPGAAPAWEPIDRRQLDPSPLYLVWTGAQQTDAHRYPWPYQLAAIEVAPFESLYPHTAPTGEPEGSAAWRGFAIFRRECVACHAVNGEGGTVGPELNVPRSVVEYRPKAQLAEFIRDPKSFRYTSMPSNLHLSDADLDALLAYFTAMSERKRDPGAPK